jgi:hypothetical protein
MFHILGASLAKETGKDEILCRGMLRMAITNSVNHLRQISDPVRARTETVDYAAKMTYQDWKTLIEGPLFSRTLMTMGMKDAAAIPERLMQTLIEQQSLFTMAAY